MSPSRRKPPWSAWQALGWGLGGIGGGIVVAGINAALALPTGPGMIAAAGISGAAGAGGGFTSGFLGHVLGHVLDDEFFYPDIRPAILFGLTFSVLIASVLGFIAIGFMAAHPDSQELIAVMIAAVAGFVPPGLNGIRNNLRNEYFRNQRF